MAEPLTIGELYATHYAMAYRIGIFLLKNHADTEDVVQDAFLNVIRHRDQFRGDAQFSTWLHTIVRNTALMVLRKRRPESLDSLMEGDPASNKPGIDPLVTDRHLELTPERVMLDDAIASLPDSLQRDFLLHDVEGIEAEALATMFETSTTAMKSRLHRARRRVRTHLAEGRPTAQRRGLQ